MKSLVEEASTIQKAIEKAWIRAGKPVEFTVKVFEEPKHNFLGMTTKSAKVAIFFKAPITQQKAPVAQHSGVHADRKEMPSSNNNTRGRERSTPTRAFEPRGNGPVDERRQSTNDRSPRQPRYAAEQATDRSQQRRPYQPTQRAGAAKPMPSAEPVDRPVSEKSLERPFTPHAEHQNRSSEPRSNERPARRPESRYGRSAERVDATWSNEMADIAQDWLENMLGMLDKRDALGQVKVVGENLKFEFKQPLLDDREREKALFASCTHLMLATVGNKYKKDLRGLRIILSREE